MLTSSARATKESFPSGTSPSSCTCAEDDIWTKVLECVEIVYGTPETYVSLASLILSAPQQNHIVRLQVIRIIEQVLGIDDPAPYTREASV